MRIPFLNFTGMHAPISSELKGAAEAVIDSNWYVNGQHVKSFESNWASYCGTKYCSGVSNGLDALILSLRALNVGPGDEVLVPSNTYIATVLAVTSVGATPVFVDPHPEFYNITSDNLEDAVTSKTRCVMPVHLYGQAVSMEGILEFAAKHDLFVVEDNAQSQGAEFDGRRTGSFGHCNATSFYPGKNLGALGDAGAVTTDSEELYQRVTLLKNYGSRVKYFNEMVGYNNRLDEMQAAMLQVKLPHLERWSGERKQIAEWYIEGLEGIGDIILPKTQVNCTHVYHLFVIQTEYRQSLMDFLASKGIGTLIHYPVPPHLQECYQDLGYKKGDFPIAERLAARTLSLPLYPGLRREDVGEVTRAIKTFFDGLG